MADNTDLYMFRDPVDPTKVNDHRQLHRRSSTRRPARTSTASATTCSTRSTSTTTVTSSPDITYQFRFRTIVGTGDTFLYNTGQVDLARPTPNQNVQQVYSVRKIDEDGAHHDAGHRRARRRRPTSGSARRRTTRPTSPSRRDARSPVAARCSPASATTRSSSTSARSSTCSACARSTRPTWSRCRPPPASDGLAGNNVPHASPCRCPITSVTTNGHGAHRWSTAKDSVVGVYASASRQRVKVLSLAGGAPRNAGRWVQVSRLGIPLVNEVLIPLGQKDLWNAHGPQGRRPVLPEHPRPRADQAAPGAVPRASPRPQGGFDAGGGDPTGPTSWPCSPGQVAGLVRRQRPAAGRPAAGEPGRGARRPTPTAWRSSPVTPAASRTAAASATTWSTSSCGCSPAARRSPRRSTSSRTTPSPTASTTTTQPFMDHFPYVEHAVRRLLPAGDRCPVHRRRRPAPGCADLCVAALPACREGGGASGPASARSGADRLHRRVEHLAHRPGHRRRPRQALAADARRPRRPAWTWPRPSCRRPGRRPTPRSTTRADDAARRAGRRAPATRSRCARRAGHAGARRRHRVRRRPSTLGRQALALAPGNEGGYGVVVDALNELGRYDEALAATQAMVDARPGLRGAVPGVLRPGAARRPAGRHPGHDPGHRRRRAQPPARTWPTSR